uniref:AlNc14C343G10821 protein n=1 Tax=Albugo laibachii Nc14 TaxID=890382 RepID=F0WX62_9STRA|nr:AlNc14C343G10821 [Albugo laibachii Nc14]|eukprot:CCA26053.1 AlNc14C343G10821 [Albugo laibachii Nc14]
MISIAAGRSTHISLKVLKTKHAGARKVVFTSYSYRRSKSLLRLRPFKKKEDALNIASRYSTGKNRNVR